MLRNVVNCLENAKLMPSDSLSSSSCRAVVMILPESLICSAAQPSPSSTKLSVMAARAAGVWPFCDHQKTLHVQRGFVHSRAPSCVVSPTSVARVWPRTLTQLRVARSAGDNSIGSPSSYVSMVASQTQRRRTRRRNGDANGDANVSKFPKFPSFS
jgi:hypothetical protein